METLTDTNALADFCAEAAAGRYVTVDTEFLRERTYYAQLCLVQLAQPGKDGRAVIVDPLAEGMTLTPLFDLFADESVTKVFHAARQDMEIFHQQAGFLPRPVFDTQIAAMVCGYGEQAGYETLVRKIAKATLDKSSRFTDWSRRPLSEAQLSYALADVTHLRVIYERLDAELERTGRRKWLAEELATLTDPETYVVRPEEAWKRLKLRSRAPRFLAAVQALARFREEEAQRRNVPRGRLLKDDALIEVASLRPADVGDLSRARLLTREARKGALAEGLVAAARAAEGLDPAALPRPETAEDPAQVNPALADLLRVLLKAKATESGVAQKLIATAADLDRIAAGERELPALRGWRAELFGDDALRLCRGELALTVEGRKIRLIGRSGAEAGEKA